MRLGNGDMEGVAFERKTYGRFPLSRLFLGAMPKPPKPVLIPSSSLSPLIESNGGRSSSSFLGLFLFVLVEAFTGALVLGFSVTNTDVVPLGGGGMKGAALVGRGARFVCRVDLALLAWEVLCTFGADARGS